MKVAIYRLLVVIWLLVVEASIAGSYTNLEDDPGSSAENPVSAPNRRCISCAFNYVKDILHGSEKEKHTIIREIPIFFRPPTVPVNPRIIQNFPFGVRGDYVSPRVG